MIQVRTLQKIAQSGSLVVLSIHQPSYRIMGLFNRLIILAFGQKVYGGTPTEMQLFFEEFGRPVPKYENSTEHALDLIQELHASKVSSRPMLLPTFTFTSILSTINKNTKPLPNFLTTLPVTSTFILLCTKTRNLF